MRYKWFLKIIFSLFSFVWFAIRGQIQLTNSSYRDDEIKSNEIMEDAVGRYCAWVPLRVFAKHFFIFEITGPVWPDG